MKKLLETKAAKKAKNPKFVRDESFKRKEVGSSWRKPRGQCSKVRKCKAGHMSMPNVGYRTPAALRGALSSGLVPVVVQNTAQVKDLDAKKNVAIVSSALGAKKKLVVVKALEAANIKIHNVDPKKFEADVKARMDKKKAAKKAAKKADEEKAKPKKKEAKKKTAKKKAPKKEASSDEEGADKKELDKILTKKQ